MTLAEFKAWFEGFTEGMEGRPTEAQFKRIKAKVKEINDQPLTREVIVEKYRDYPWFRPYWYGGSWGYSSGGSGFSTSSGGYVSDNLAVYTSGDSLNGVDTAFMLGRAEFENGHAA